jgi:thiamine pyrophosphate-dependent acetolactate synthase large subunit-like protein
VKRYECLKLLAPMVDKNMLTVTSLSSNTAFWSSLRQEGPSFFGCNMGLCIPFALGLTAAFPNRKVVALDSDGSLMVDTSSLITVADVNPVNFVAIVFDNGSYARMGSTFTTRRTDLEKIAQGAGIAKTETVQSEEAFSAAARRALETAGPHFIVAKVEPDRQRVKGDPHRTYGRAMREWFMDAVRQHPDYQGKRNSGD